MPSPIHIQEHIISGLECDFQNHWKPVYVLQAMQRAANIHAAALGAGFETLAAHGQTWVFSRFKLCFYTTPGADQPITIRTFVKGISQKLFFRRDFQLFTADGQLCAAATTAWLLLDTNARRLLPPAALKAQLPDPPDLVGLDETLEKLNPPADLEPGEVVRAGYNTIDLLGHVNNTRYVEWVTDCFPFEQYRTHRLAWLQINYNNEVLPGEQVALFRATNPAQPTRWWVVGENLVNGKRAFEAEVGWEAILS